MCRYLAVVIITGKQCRTLLVQKSIRLYACDEGSDVCAKARFCLWVSHRRLREWYAGAAVDE